MQKLIYAPPGGDLSLPETCALLELAKPFVLGTVTGTGAPPTTVISSTVPGVDGEFVQGIRMESREIKCTVNIFGKDRAGMYAQRFRLAKLLTPGDTPGMLYYANDFTTLRIPAIPLSSPEFTARMKNYNQAEITFHCPSPFWESTEEQNGSMAYLDEGFEFPFEFSVQFAGVENRTTLNNAGSVPAPLEIGIRGPATNPAVVQSDTGEFIRLSSLLEEGETISINTRPGAKNVIISHRDGTKENAYHYIDPRSVFFQLRPGENHLRYQSDNESEQTQIVLRYRERYVGV